MDAHIRWSQNVTEEDAYLLEKLADLIKKDCDVLVNLDKQEVKPGEKDSGLTIGIAIAQGWSNDAETLDFFKSVAPYDRKRSVREEAVKAIKQGWGNDFEALDFLKSLGID